MLRHAFRDPTLAALALVAASLDARMQGPVIAQDKNAYPALDTVRAQLNNLNNDVTYNALCGLSGNALPAIAQALNTTGVKTVNSVNYFVNGKPVTKAGTDNLWAMGVAGSNTLVAVSSFQKYQLLLDAAGTATTQEGVQSTASAAAVVFASLPPVTKAVIGILTIATDTTHTFTPGTTALNAAGITATFDDGIHGAIFLASLVTP